MKKRIITISRQAGSGGHEIAERLAEKLNIPLHNRNVVEEALKELDMNNIKSVDEVDEKVVVDYVAKFAKGYHAIFGKGKLYHMMDYTNDDSSVSEQLYQIQSKVIQELAEAGPCIVVGRCGDYVLKDRDDVLRVFICADKEERISRMMEKRDLSHERALNKVEFTDRDRGKYYKQYTGQEWGVPESYDITLNATTLGADGIIEVLTKLYEG